MWCMRRLPVYLRQIILVRALNVSRYNMKVCAILEMQVQVPSWF